MKAMVSSDSVFWLGIRTCFTEFIVKALNVNRLSEARFAKGSTWETVTIILTKTIKFNSHYPRKMLGSELRGKNYKLQSDSSDNPLQLSLSIKEQINMASQECVHLESSEYVDCVANEMLDTVKTLSSSKTTLISYRDKISAKLRNYTCADPHMQSPDPIEVFPLHLDGRDLLVSRHLDTAHAQILTAENFITDEECALLEEYGSTRLHRATVAAEDGTSTISKSRQAQQAGYELSGVDDPLWSVKF